MTSTDLRCAWCARPVDDGAGLPAFFAVAYHGGCWDALVEGKTITPGTKSGEDRET